MHIGVGLNTDNIVWGNISSKKWMDFTMIGDGVNLAARLESACKQYGAKILISEFTQARLKGTYHMREVDLVVVKGKTVPIGLYEVLDYHTDASFPKLMDVLGLFKDGLAKYRQMKWDAAETQFHKCLELHPHDAVSTMYLERCAILRKNPPVTVDGKWNGVWVLEGK